MKADVWFPFYPSDYLRKTMRLTRDQHGGYILLLIACWDGGGRLPNDPADLAAIVLASPAEWRKLAPKLLPYFEDHGEWLVHTRVQEEHQKAARLSEARRDAGAKGGRPKKENETADKPIGFANDKQNETPTLVARPSPSPVPSEHDADDDARRPDQIWTSRLAEVQAIAGTGIDLVSPAVHHYADLRMICEPSSGEPCTWDEVREAIKACAAVARQKGKPIRSWTWVKESAYALRDRRLAGAPPVRTIEQLPSIRQTLGEKVGAESEAAKVIALKALSNG